MRSILHSPVVCEEEDGIMSGEFWMAGNKIFLLCVKFDKTWLTAPGKNDMIIAIIRIPGKSSGVQSAHGCVVVLGGREAGGGDCVLLPPPFATFLVFR